MIKEVLKRHEVVVRYLTFGVLTTFVGWFVYFGILFGGKALYSLPPEDTTSRTYIMIYTVAQILQWIAAVLFAFFTNKKWVFTDADLFRRDRAVGTHSCAQFGNDLRKRAQYQRAICKARRGDNRRSL